MQPLSIESLVDMLGHIESLPEEFRDKRYLVVHELDPESFRDPPSADHPLMENKKRLALRVVGETADLGKALAVLWAEIEAIAAELSSGEAEFPGD